MIYHQYNGNGYKNQGFCSYHILHFLLNYYNAKLHATSQRLGKQNNTLTKGCLGCDKLSTQYTCHLQQRIYFLLEDQET